MKMKFLGVVLGIVLLAGCNATMPLTGSASSMPAFVNVAIPTPSASSHGPVLQSVQ